MVSSQTSTPMQDWVARALDRMQPILDGSDTYAMLTDQDMGSYFEVEKDTLTDMLERVEWLVQHFKVLPEPSTARCEGSIALGHDCKCLCWQAGGIAALVKVVDRMEAQA